MGMLAAPMHKRAFLVFFLALSCAPRGRIAARRGRSHLARAQWNRSAGCDPAL